MTLLMRYVRHFMDLELIDEFHAWNFTRAKDDEAWLQEELGHSAQWKTVGNSLKYEYVQVPGAYLNHRALTLRFRTEHDAHLSLADNSGDLIEIIFGGWSNTKTAVRLTRQGRVLFSVPLKIRTNKWNYVTISDDTNGLRVAFNDERPFTVNMRPRRGSVAVHVAGWDDATCAWEIEQHREVLFNPNRCNCWNDYYNFYTEERFPNSIIIKCDDDVVFLDPSSFPDFIRYSATSMGDHLFAFPSIINNGVCAHHQQASGLLPVDVFGHLEYAAADGRLWGDGVLCERVHEYFIQNVDSVIQRASELPPIPHRIGDRISINCFAVRSEDLGCAFNQTDWPDDEGFLSTELTKRLQRSHVIVQSCLVSHLAFHKQRSTGLDEQRCVSMYGGLASRALGDRDGR